MENKFCVTTITKLWPMKFIHDGVAKNCSLTFASIIIHKIL